MLALLLLAFMGFVAAQYGVPAANPAPVHSPAVPIYPSQPVILLPHHHHSSSSSSSSESHEHKRKCQKCPNLERTCPTGVENCFLPKPTILTHKGCKAVFVECRQDNFLTALVAKDGNEVYTLAVAENRAGALLKCSGKEWKAVEIENGKKISPDNVYCQFIPPTTTSIPTTTTLPTTTIPTTTPATTAPLTTTAPTTTQPTTPASTIITSTVDPRGCNINVDCAHRLNIVPQTDDRIFGPFFNATGLEHGCLILQYSCYRFDKPYGMTMRVSEKETTKMDFGGERTHELVQLFVCANEGLLAYEGFNQIPVDENDNYILTEGELVDTITCFAV